MSDKTSTGHALADAEGCLCASHLISLGLSATNADRVVRAHERILTARGGNTDNTLAAAVEYVGAQVARILTDERVRPFGSDRIFLAAHNAQNRLAETLRALDAAPAPTDNQRDDGLADRVRALADQWQRQVTTLRADRSAGDLLAGDLANQLAHHVAALRAVVDGPTTPGGGS